MGGIEIVAKDKEGKIKQDLKVSRDKELGKVVEVDELKKKEVMEKKSK